VDDAALKKRNLTARMTDYRKKTVAEAMVAGAGVLVPEQKLHGDSVRKAPSDFFESEFVAHGGVVDAVFEDEGVAAGAEPME